MEQYSMVPKTPEEINELVKYFQRSRNIKNKETGGYDLFYLIRYGAELDLSPTQALQWLCVVNGKISIMGDGLLAMVFQSGHLENIKETIEGSIEEGTLVAHCTVKRKGIDELTSSFSIEDAKRAGLWKDKPTKKRNSKTGEIYEVTSPWYSYPKRMLKYRALGFALRDRFPDVLKGVIIYEEALDYPPEKVINMTKETPSEQPIKIEQKPESRYSKVLEESYIKDGDKIVFESGVEYTKKEMKDLFEASDEQKKFIHQSKKEFLGKEEFAEEVKEDSK